MLAECDLLFAFADGETGELVGFARVLTDFVYRAYLFDVIVKASHRGRGVGEALMEAVVRHPRLQNVDTLELWCRPELVPFYEKWGFGTDLGELKVMVRRRSVVS